VSDLDRRLSAQEAETNRRLYLLAGIATALLAATAVIIFTYPPPDAIQGNVQRIFYFHVSSVIAAYGCFALVVIGGVLYLWKGSQRWDRLARAGAVVGLPLTTVCIVMGIIWAQPVWNWNPAESWDARFTSTVALWAIYAGYLLIRKFAPQGHAAARLSSVVGIVGFIDVPVVYFSVDWWRTLHPANTMLTSALTPKMLQTFILTQLVMFFFAAVLVAIWYRVEARRDARVEEEAQVALRLSTEAH
jgi:heme exporter protein C